MDSSSAQSTASATAGSPGGGAAAGGGSSPAASGAARASHPTTVATEAASSTASAAAVGDVLNPPQWPKEPVPRNHLLQRDTFTTADSATLGARPSRVIASIIATMQLLSGPSCYFLARRVRLCLG